MAEERGTHDHDHDHDRTFQPDIEDSAPSDSELMAVILAQLHKVEVESDVVATGYAAGTVAWRPRVPAPVLAPWEISSSSSTPNGRNPPRTASPVFSTASTTC